MKQNVTTNFMRCDMENACGCGERGHVWAAPLTNWCVRSRRRQQSMLWRCFDAFFRLLKSNTTFSRIVLFAYEGDWGIWEKLTNLLFAFCMFRHMRNRLFMPFFVPFCLPFHTPWTLGFVSITGHDQINVICAPANLPAEANECRREVDAEEMIEIPPFNMIFVRLLCVCVLRWLFYLFPKCHTFWWCRNRCRFSAEYLAIYQRIVGAKNKTHSNGRTVCQTRLRAPKNTRKK